MANKKIVWDSTAPIGGTFFRTYLNSRFGFRELVGRLSALSHQPVESPDEYKLSVEFVGLFNGEVFTLYDYKEDRKMHIGGGPGLDVVGLQKELDILLETVDPVEYQAEEYYDQCLGYGWPK